MRDIWWTQMPDSVDFINSVVEAIEESHSVVMEITLDFPWYDTMTLHLENKLYDVSSEYSLEQVYDDEREPGDILLNSFFSEDERLDYRPHKGYADFFAGTESLFNYRIIWVKNLTAQRFKKWFSLVEEYNRLLRKKQSGALFILETESIGSMRAGKRIDFVSLNQSNGMFSSYLFNIRMAAAKPLNERLRYYLAELSSAVNGLDIERSCVCQDERYFEDFMEKPYETLQQIVACEMRENGNAYSSDTAETVERDTWKAQLRYIFPKLELYRSELVQKYYHQLEHMDAKNKVGGVYESPNEMELGFLYYAAYTRRLNLPDAEYRKLEIFKDARNRLAHGKALEFAMVRDVLDRM